MTSSGAARLVCCPRALPTTCSIAAGESPSSRMSVRWLTLRCRPYSAHESFESFESFGPFEPFEPFESFESFTSFESFGSFDLRNPLEPSAGGHCRRMWQPSRERDSHSARCRWGRVSPAAGHGEGPADREARGGGRYQQPDGPLD